MADFVELRHYVTVILKRWWVVLLALAVALALGYGLTQRQERLYSARATLLVGRSIQTTDVSGQDFRTSEQLAETYAALVQRQPILQGTVDALGFGYPWQRLRGRVSASPVDGTQLLEVMARAETPERAVLIADEVARQLVILSPTALQNQESAETADFVQERLDNLRSKIEAGQGRLDELQNVDVTGLPTEEVTELQSEIQALEDVIAEWESNYAQLLAVIGGERSANYLTIIETAQARSNPVQPNVQLNMAIATVLGLSAGLALAFGLEHLDDTVKVTDDLGQLFGLQSLGVVNEMKGKGYQDALIVPQNGDGSFLRQFSPESEAFRMIRSNIRFMSVDRLNRSLLVTSSVRGEGKSVTAANLGVVMAQAGLNTVIVDADLRRPVQHSIFEVPNSTGLAGLLLDPSAVVAHFLEATHVPGLHVLTSGSLPPNPAELVGSKRMRQVMAELAEIADVVIYDSPPATLVADAAILSERVDGTVLVIDEGETRRPIVQHAVLNLRQAEANLLGAIFNRVSKRVGGVPYGYYRGDEYSQHIRQGRLDRVRKALPFLR